MKEQQQSFIEQTAFSSEKYMQYKTAESKMTAMAVDAGVKIGKGVDMAKVTEADLLAAKRMCATHASLSGQQPPCALCPLCWLVVTTRSICARLTRGWRGAGTSRCSPASRPRRS